MTSLVELECTPSCRSRQHGSQINSAIIRGSEEQAIAYMKKLCHRCWSVTDKTGKTALHTAASCGKRKVISWLLSQGAPINQRDWESGYTPLHRALFYGQIHAACALIEAGGKISALDHDALTPLDHVNFDRPFVVPSYVPLDTDVYVWGSNTNYNLGQPNQHGRGTPESLEFFHREGQMIKKVALSKFHTLFLAHSGRVYACGHGQGGRLGLDTNTPVITPRPVKAFMHMNVVEVAVGPDHSLFLTDSGQVWSCGNNLYHQLGLSPPPEHAYTPRLLTWHKSHKEKIVGIAAAKYHSVMWTSRVLYTFGLNAGQLGHIKSESEHTVVTPRNVTSLYLKEDAVLSCVGVSDGATVMSTSYGDVYVLHQYQIRKIASKLCGLIVKVACVGGHLDSRVEADGLVDYGGHDLQIAVLTGQGGAGHLYMWTEQLSHLSRCLFTLSREISIKDFCLSLHCLGIVTQDGEAFSAVVLPSREPKTAEKSTTRKFFKSSGQLVEFLDYSTCITLRLTRIAALHRTVGMMCDPKGQNFVALQSEPRRFLLDLPNVSSSTLKKDLGILLDEADVMDTIHDVVIMCGSQKFPTHSQILASHSGYFRRHLVGEKHGIKVNGTDSHKVWDSHPDSTRKYIHLSDIQPDVLKEVLTYIYTGSCQLMPLDSTDCKLSFDQALNVGSDNTQGMENWTGTGSLHQRSAITVNEEEMELLKTTTKQRKKRKSRESAVKTTESNLISITRSVAKKLEVAELLKELNKLTLDDGHLEMNTSMHSKDTELEKENDKIYTRETHKELWDVMIRSKNGDILGAHKCILAARLEYFHCMFGSSWIEASSSTPIDMPLPTSILTIILDYLYEDESPKLRQYLDPEFVCNVLTVADQLLIVRLKEICEEVISGLLTLKNAAELLEFATRYNADQLKTSAMQFISLNLAAMLESGSLLCLSNDVLAELSGYYRQFIPRMSCRLITPHDHPPYAEELEQILDKSVTSKESDDDCDSWSSVKGDKVSSSGGGVGSVRKKKRQRRNSQGDGRSRKASTSSVVSTSSSDCDLSKDLDELETLNFDDLEDRVPSESPYGKSDSETCISPKLELVLNSQESNETDFSVQSEPDIGSWQKVCKRKSSASQNAVLSRSSSKESPVEESTYSDRAQTPRLFTEEPQSRVIDEPSLPKFPSIQDTLSVSQKASQQPRASKIGKLSQKQRKKLAAEAAAAAELSTSEGSRIPWQNSCVHPSPAWGTVEDPSVTVNSSRSSQTLADIMKAEEARCKQIRSPLPTQGLKKSHKQPIPNKKDWRKGESPPVDQQSTEKEGSGMWSVVASSPPTQTSDVDRNLPSPGLRYFERGLTPPQHVEMPSFSHILLEEETHTDNLIKERSKPLAKIQLEDQAIEELYAFYGATECFEEKITVTRVKAAVVNPTWSK